MAKAKVKVFGTGNFVIGDTLYAFRQATDRDGNLVDDTVEADNTEHAALLKAESLRREKVYTTTLAHDDKYLKKDKDK